MADGKRRAAVFALDYGSHNFTRLFGVITQNCRQFRTAFVELVKDHEWACSAGTPMRPNILHVLKVDRSHGLLEIAKDTAYNGGKALAHLVRHVLLNARIQVYRSDCFRGPKIECHSPLHGVAAEFVGKFEPDAAFEMQAWDGEAEIPL
jgi:hypothetical protein